MTWQRWAFALSLGLVLLLLLRSARHDREDSDEVEEWQHSQQPGSTSKGSGVPGTLSGAELGREAPWGGRPCHKLPVMHRQACRPSYLIIGADKSATSSLYFYLQAHPKVVSARQKQIQFFDHAYSLGVERYLYQSFPHRLQRGEMTGEASPGYMVYSVVPPRILRDLPEVRILLMARDPVERAYSGYKYNYLRKLQPGATPIPFDTMVRWEIERVLNPCHAAMAQEGDGASMDMSKQCFGRISKRVQFAEVYSGKPDFNGMTWSERSLPFGCDFGCHQMVARGLYVNMMKWWYDIFPANQIHVVCTESLSPPPAGARTMAEVAAFLGLPAYDFLPAVAKGRYNIEGHEGYRNLSPWRTKKQVAHSLLNNATRAYLRNYYRLFNERFFKMMGKRCETWQ